MLMTALALEEIMEGCLDFAFTEYNVSNNISNPIFCLTPVKILMYES